jgi:glucose/arabinose dehydrogenase
MKGIPGLFAVVRGAVLVGAIAGAQLVQTQGYAFDCSGVTPVSGDDITLDQVTASLNRPVDVGTPPGDVDRLFVVEQGGLIRIIRLADDSIAPTPFLDIRSRVVCCGERGLLGLAFHPNYAENGYFYVNYTRSAGTVCTTQPPPGCTGNRDSETVIARYSRMAEDPDRADPNSAEIVLAFCQPFSNHNGGQLAFGPLDGYLYASTGDGGSGGDPCSSGQRGTTFLGKLLRLDVDGDDFPEDANRNYAIPPTNPFNSPTDGVFDEIWALGLRNPWRLAFDPTNGDLYIGDVGQNLYEEVDYVPGTSDGGENYEWRVQEGLHAFNAGTPYGAGTRVAPIYEYPHGSGVFKGCSVTGGVVYRGCRMPDLHGSYFVADYCNDWIGTFRVVDGRLTDLRDRTADLNMGISPNRADEISAFGVDGRGEVYICDLDTTLFRVVPRGFTDVPPTARIRTVPSPADVELAEGLGLVTLDGSASDDGNGGVQGLTFAWTKLSGPEGATIQSPTAAVTQLRLTEAGDFVFRLTVNDGVGSDASDVPVRATEPPPLPMLRRGDTNGDGKVDISDGISSLGYLFGGDEAPSCFDAADANDSGDLDLADSVFTFNYLFLGRQAPPDPGPDTCGADPTDGDGLDCASSPLCV